MGMEKLVEELKKGLFKRIFFYIGLDICGFIYTMIVENILIK